MKKLKLNNLAKDKLQDQEMKLVNGGYIYVCDVTGYNCCGCGCYYADSGGSSSYDNGSRNHKGGLSSPMRQE